MSLRTTTVTKVSLVRQYPVDAAIVSILAIGAYLVVTGEGWGTSARLIATFGLVGFLPGYAFVSFLFPASPVSEGRDGDGPVRRIRGIDPAERLGLSIVVSIAIAVLVALALGTTDWRLYMDGPPNAFVLLTVGFAQLGAIRRLRVPRAMRFTVSPTAWVLGLQRSLRDEPATVVASTVLTLAIAIAVIALVGSLLAPLSAGGFTQVAVYGEDDGELVAGDTEDQIEPGESLSLITVIDNHEGEETEYTLVVQEQTVEDGSVVDEATLQTVDATVDNDSSASVDLEVTPTTEPEGASEEPVRISVLAYHGDPPANPTNENADHDLYVWVTIAEDVDEE